MAVLGKRKAPDSSTRETDAHELLRRHFEATFQPLAGSASTPSPPGGGQADEANSEGDSEWGGLSDDSGDDSHSDDGHHARRAPSGDGRPCSSVQRAPAVQIIDHSAPRPPGETMSRRQLRAFMSSRPPDQTAFPDPVRPSGSSKSSALPEDAPSLLKQDLELRRLLAESHLLAPHAATKSLSSVSSNAPQPKSFAAGRIRHKATDLRIQALGSKLSIHGQHKMPMHMRKGMVAASHAREAKRRREAKENGIILERETGKKRRQRGPRSDVDRPSVGRLKGAELRITDRDVKRIEGKRDVFGRRAAR
ncbi:uncharacterized protein MAM_02352 [Metarhizium album ARSEF 1941]|uniref:Uncharacterized protein n=1 Tax=Metarhizium album (strain ARSEF 1941) TaxID=1081103 RepID=A0A0B2X0V6_METAS|nr:uncharacterized protein MAM_02352 [Metarhizium album ARSEF 1941]KHN99499.1 hypothetical protein MAM_02352 [Metarhizium album ARSEF 1941]